MSITRNSNPLVKFTQSRWSNFEQCFPKDILWKVLAVMGFVFGMVGVVALVRLDKRTKTLKQKGILAEDYKEEYCTVPKQSVTVE